jgi:cAMP-dependent protein kinase regulator
MEEGRYQAGDVLMVQGDPGDWFHYIIQGKVEVLQARLGEDLSHSKRIATLGVGEPVGEMALSFGTPRNATVRALTEVHTLSLEANDFRELFRRGAVA